MKLPNQKGFVPVSIFIVILVVVLIGGVFYFVNSKKLPQPSQQSVSGNFKTYKNTKYGFQFEFDKDSKIIYEGKDGVLLKIDYPKKSRNSTSDGKSFISGSFGIENIENCKNYGLGKNSSSVAQVTIDSRSIPIAEAEKNDKRAQFHIYACLEKNGTAFLFYDLYLGYDNSGTPEAFTDKDRKFFMQVLNSFKFVSTGGRTDKTYISKNLGVNFLYSPITNYGDKVVIKEVGNKIFAYVEGQDFNNLEDLEYIEVINVESNSNIIDAMSKYVRQYFPNDGCIKVYNIQGVYPKGSNSEQACGLSKSRGHADYFLYDKNNPIKFVFINIDFKDSYGLTSSKNFEPVLTYSYENWYSTLGFQ